MLRWWSHRWGTRAKRIEIMRILFDSLLSQATRFSDGTSRGLPRLPSSLGRVCRIDTLENSQPIMYYPQSG